MRTALRRTTTTVLFMTAAALATGCAESGGTSAASCAGLYTYGKRTYLPVDKGDFTVGDKLGTASSVPCDDTPNDGAGPEPVRRSTAYAVEGMDSGTAIAVGDTPADVQFMRVHNP